MTRQANFNIVLQGMRLFEITEIGFVVVVKLGLDVFALHKEQAAHPLHVLRQTSLCAFGHRNHYRQSAHANQKLEMKFANVVDELMFAGSAPGDDQDGRAFHCSRTRSASTSRESLSRPWEATRMWRSSMPTLFEQSRTYI